MKILLKKAMRGIWRNKKTYVACIFLIMVGVVMYVSFGISGAALQTAKSDFYEQTNFADAFARVRGISRSGANSLLIDGVETVSARVKIDAEVYIPDSDTFITLRLTSRHGDPLNQILIYDDDVIEETDILVGQGFLDAWGLELGDEIDIILNNQLITFTIRGAFSSPEYLYLVAEGGAIIPDEATFNIGVVKESTLLALNGGLFNDIAFGFEYGVEFDDIQLELEEALHRYGLISLISRENQLSNSILTMEIDYIVAMGNSVPIMFIAMAVMILYLMLKRMIEQERSQIGTLKAFGYTKTQIIVSYASYGMITGAIGGILGGVLGWIASGFLIDLFGEFFKIPNLVPSGAATFIIGGLILAIIGGGLGSIIGAKSTLKLQPAESMRPAAPKVKHKARRSTSVSRFFKRHSSTTAQMAIRSISRSKARSVFIVFGIAFTYAFLTFGASYANLIDGVILSHYNHIHTFDGRINFIAPIRNAESSIEGISGVTYAEGILEFPVEFEIANRSRTAMLTGISENSTLINIHCTDRGINFPPPTNGIILTVSLADNLGVRIGEYIGIRPMGGNRIYARVQEIVQQPLTTGGYLAKKFMRDIMEQGGMQIGAGSSAVVFMADDMAAIRRLAREGTNVLSFEDQAHTREAMTDMLEPYAAIGYIFLLFGILIGFAICYNTASISLMERKREYSTLRVMGMHMKEVANIMGFEYWILALAGIIVGLPLPRAMLVGINNMMSDMDMFSMSTHVSLQSYIVGLVCALLAIYLSNKSNVRNVRKMAMVEVLKERE